MPQGGPLSAILFSKTLNLTAAQKSEIQAIVNDHGEAMEQARETMKSAHKELFKYLKQGGADTAELQRLTSRSGEALKQLELAGAATFIEAYAVLTAEQKTMVASKELHKFGGRWKKHGANRE